MSEMQSPPLGYDRRPCSNVRTVASAALLLAIIFAGCSSGEEAKPVEVDATVITHAFDEPPVGAGSCTGAFRPIELKHTTTGRGVITAMSDGTGAGVLLEDLDQDGMVDIVLPNLTGDTAVLWNEGDLTFTAEPLINGRFRQALAIDANQDGHRDILLTTGIGPPVLLVADDGPASPRSFTRAEFRTRAVTYSVAAADLGGDGSLSVITGSYNAELTQNRDLRALTGVDVGVAVHTIADGAINTEFLTEQAQALVTMAADLNGDGIPDVLVGNDLGTPDGIWFGGPDGLAGVTPFDTTTLSTMSIDVVDFDNDGDADVIATDMAPMPGEDPAPWLEVASDIESAMIDDVQEPRNKVQFQGEDGFDDRAEALGVEATGWSWSGVAGDLDNNGLLDLYVVNGMQATSIFPNLPDGALIEENQAFRNTDGGLVPAPEWELGSSAGGRGMAQADLDNDGDLDVVINNLGTPSVVMENQLCGGSSLVVEPRWDDVQNQDAIGATVMVTDGDKTYTRQILSNRGYISSPPSQAHVGLGDLDEDATVTVTVSWPDGAATVLDDVAVDQRLVVQRSAAPIARASIDGVDDEEQR